MLQNGRGRFRPSAFIFTLVLTAAACSESPSPSVTAKAPEAGLRLQEPSQKYVEVETVGKADAGLGVLLPGRVAFRPQAMAATASPVAARVLSIQVRPGQPVKAGDPLLTLQSADAAAARASVAQASAKAAAATDALRRQEEMIKRGVGLEVERFAARTAAREAQAELERARQTMAGIGDGGSDRFVLKAPAGGVVLTVKTNVGAVVSAGGDALVEIGDPSRLWVIADVPETDMAGITSGRRAEVRVPAADARFDAVVDGVARVVDGQQLRLPVYLTLKGATDSLAPGMLAEVRLIDAGEGALSLPTTAVLIKDGSKRIVYFQNDDGSFEPREVRTGVARNGRVTILEGVKPGDKVVMRGALLLDGQAEQLL